MIEVPITRVKCGDVLAKPVYARNGIILLDAGITLTEQYITRLRKLNVEKVYLRLKYGGLRVGTGAQQELATYADDWELPDIDKMKENKESLEEAEKSALKFTENIRGLEPINLPVPDEKFRKCFRDMIGEIVSNREFVEELSVMLQTDSLLFQKALQVALIANAIGTVRGYNQNQLYELTLGSIFSDLGMTRLPANLTRVSRKLTDVERAKLREHTTEGYKLLLRMKNVPLEAAKIALQHHERYRGEGYPLGLKADEICEYAQIVGLTDVYNALISVRHHRNAYSAEEALEYLFAAGNYDFDLDLVQTFLRHLKIYPAGTSVLLSNGQAAYVVETAGRLLLRPVVQVYREADGSAIASPYLIDLEKQPNLAILRKLK